ncbi:MAG: cupin domain-containing protein [Alphaproteobacteria bacterium]|jgi:quercetin dioxygenase-like cupin family protein|nr:cupin domain-containing protein [Alphaproteobacteria bacterium]
MSENDKLGYKIKGRERIAVAEDLRVSILTLDAGEEVPWHSHDIIDDDFFCMEGPMQVETRRPDAVQVLNPGETFKAPAGQPHRVTGVDDGPCKFMIVQGVGKYNFVPE